MKYLRFLLLFIILTMLSSCTINDSTYISLKSNKPTPFYYSSELYSKIKKSSNFTLEVFDRDVYKYYEVGEEDMDIVISFLESLNNDNYVSESISLDSPRYKLIVKLNNSKYIINVYSADMVSINPWDGVFPQDIIKMDGVSTRNNIYSFCKYIINKSHDRSKET